MMSDYCSISLLFGNKCTKLAVPAKLTVVQLKKVSAKRLF